MVVVFFVVVIDAFPAFLNSVKVLQMEALRNQKVEILDLVIHLAFVPLFQGLFDQEFLHEDDNLEAALKVIVDNVAMHPTSVVDFFEVVVHEVSSDSALLVGTVVVVAVVVVVVARAPARGGGHVQVHAAVTPRAQARAKVCVTSTAVATGVEPPLTEPHGAAERVREVVRAAECGRAAVVVVVRGGGREVVAAAVAVRDSKVHPGPTATQAVVRVRAVHRGHVLDAVGPPQPPSQRAAAGGDVAAAPAQCAVVAVGVAALSGGAPVRVRPVPAGVRHRTPRGLAHAGGLVQFPSSAPPRRRSRCAVGSCQNVEPNTVQCRPHLIVVPGTHARQSVVPPHGLRRARPGRRLPKH